MTGINQAAIEGVTIQLNNVAWKKASLLKRLADKQCTASRQDAEVTNAPNCRQENRRTKFSSKLAFKNGTARVAVNLVNKLHTKLRRTWGAPQLTLFFSLL